MYNKGILYNIYDSYHGMLKPIVYIVLISFGIIVFLAPIYIVRNIYLDYKSETYLKIEKNKSKTVVNKVSNKPISLSYRYSDFHHKYISFYSNGNKNIVVEINTNTCIFTKYSLTQKSIFKLTNIQKHYKYFYSYGYPFSSKSKESRDEYFSKSIGIGLANSLFYSTKGFKSPIGGMEINEYKSKKTKTDLTIFTLDEKLLFKVKRTSDGYGYAQFYDYNEEQIKMYINVSSSPRYNYVWIIVDLAIVFLLLFFVFYWFRYRKIKSYELNYQRYLGEMKKDELEKSSLKYK